MHDIEKEAIENIAGLIKEGGNGGRNIVDVALELIDDDYDKNWVREALQQSAKSFDISDEELNNYLMINISNAKKS
ncbi:MAG: hypothetical protein ABIJ85_00070 [bacterium]